MNTNLNFQAFPIIKSLLYALIPILLNNFSFAQNVNQKQFFDRKIQEYEATRDLTTNKIPLERLESTYKQLERNQSIENRVYNPRYMEFGPNNVARACALQLRAG